MSAHSTPMPYEPSLACPVCGRGVDPLRARAVLATDDGIRFFCTAACRDQQRQQQRSEVDARAGRPAAPEPPEQHPAPPADVPARPAQAHGPDVPPDPRAGLGARLSPWIAGAALGAAALGQWDHAGARWSACVLLAISGCAVALSAGLQRAESGLLAWAVAPTGVFMLAASALWTKTPSLFIAAALGVGLIWLREWLGLRAERAIHALLAELSAQVPSRTRLCAALEGELDPAQTRTSETVQVRAGDEVFVAAGDVVPVDGVVSRGSGVVVPYATSPETILRRPGDALLAGAAVVEGELSLTATRVGPARALFRPLSFGQDGTPGSARPTRAITLVRNPLAILAFIAAVSTLSLPLARGFAETLVAVGTVLIALPMLSLVRGVRMPFVSAAALAASRGVVFRDADTLERAGRVQVAALCTEGAITLGAPVLAEVHALGDELDRAQLTALAMGAETGAEQHPLADAILQFGEARGIRPENLRRISYTRGRGITALVDGGGPLVLGNRQALLSAGVSVAAADREAQKAERAGRSVVFLAVGGRIRALFVFEDLVRPQARAAVQTLIDLDLEVLLISGDHRGTVESLARTLDITHVKAELTGDERGAEIERLRAGGNSVVVIGRPAHDEAALSAADISLTLDAAGGAHEGDVAAASHDLRDAAFGIEVARRTRRTALVALWVTLAGGAAVAAAAALHMLHPAVSLLMAAGIDLWTLPSAPRLLRSR